MRRYVLSLWLIAAPFAAGQSLNLSALEKFKSRAVQTVNITLDGSLLQMAAKFLSSGDPDEAQVKRVVAGLKRIVVRSFEFKEAGEYLDADVESIRAQLREPEWKRIVEIRGRKEGGADVYIRGDDEHIGGLTVIAAEPRELTVVQIDGSIRVEDLSKLSGNFGIPESVGKKRDGKSK